MRTLKKRIYRRRTPRFIRGGGRLNVLGKPLKPCNLKKVTGFYRDGFCSTGDEDAGTHVVCAIMDDPFLQYTLKQGNDLITPQGSSFPGLVAGDHWCVCALRWMEAYRAGKEPKIVLESTDKRALQYIPRAVLFSRKKK